MDQFRNLSVNMESNSSTEMRCSGCGAKIGNSILQQVLNRLPAQNAARRYCNGTRYNR
jgi:hypothetical protein